MRYTFILLLTGLIIFSSCSSTKELSDDPNEEDSPILPVDEQVAEEYIRSELDEFERILYDNRTYMSVHFSQIDQEIPEQFLKEAVREERETDQYAGFRIQILSTRDVAVADSTTDEFRAWTSEELPNYQIETYIVFRQPYYRVRAGNFKVRENAIEFSRLLKNRYPDAWVVHDRIDPERITEKEDSSEEILNSTDNSETSSDADIRN
jgi:hypothetical protein